MLRTLWIGVITVLLCASAGAQNAPIEYRISFDNAVHHEAVVTIAFKDLNDSPLELRMSRSSPGRYALHEFAKNVYDVSAVDNSGQPLVIVRTDPYSWRIDNHGDTVVVSYTLYADRADGTYSQIDFTHAHLNMPATFMWAGGMEERPIQLAITAPQKSWRAITQLPPARKAMTFTAPNLQYFMDSPIELSAVDVREWKLADGQTIRLAVHHEGNKEDMDIFADKAKKIVAEQIAVFGEAPKYDHGIYTFIADYVPHNSGDGMEHRNSTVLTSTESLYEADFEQISALSHEFFHCWNVERMRPVELEPFDFYKANPTPSLWFAEGFTNYYGDLVRVRAQVTPLDKYLEELQKTLSRIINAPGRKHGSPQAMSLQAPFVDAARAIDRTNRGNTFVSYYPYGEIIALALDLTLRQRFDDITLDDYMRHLWRLYGKTEIPYQAKDLRKDLADVTGNVDFANQFFDDYIEKGNLPDFVPLLEQAGLTLAAANPDKASLGSVNFEARGNDLLLASNTLKGSPLYNAGLDNGDQILQVGRFNIHAESDYKRALERHQPGDRVSIKYIQRGVMRDADITFVKDDTLKITPFEKLDKTMTAAQKEFRKRWLKVEVDDKE